MWHSPTVKKKQIKKKLAKLLQFFFKISCEWQTGISLVYTFKHYIKSLNQMKYISSLYIKLIKNITNEFFNQLYTS